MQALNGCYGFAVEDEWIPHRFHPQDTDFIRYQSREHLMFKTSEMRIHDIQGHLHSVETDSVNCGDFQHPQMNERILMASETDVADLACALCFHRGFDRSPFRKDSIRVFQANDLVELHQIQMIGLQPFERL